MNSESARPIGPVGRWLKIWPGLPLFALLGVVPGLLCLNAPLLLGYDDKYITVENPMITHGLGFFFEQLMLPFRPQNRVGFETPHWAPLSYLSLALEYQIFGMNPTAFRIISGLYHGACGWFVFRLSAKQMGGVEGPPERTHRCSVETKAFLATLIFLLHPTVCESVCWIIERNNILPMLFGVWALDVYTGPLERGGRDTPGWARTFGAFGLLLASQLCKASGVCWWPIMGAWDFFLMRDAAAQSVSLAWARRLGRWVLLGLPVALSIYAIKLSHADVLMEPIGSKPFGPWLMWIYLTIRYVGLLAFPVKLSAFYHVSPNGVPWGDPSLGLTCAGIVVAVIGAYKLRIPWPRIALYAFWIAVAVAPVVNPFVTTSFLIQDRYLYPAMPAFACCIVELIVETSEAFSIQRPWLIAALLPAIFLPMTMLQSTVWRSVDRLFRNSVAAQPDCSFGYCFLANEIANTTPPGADARDVQKRQNEQAALFERALLCDDYDRQQWPLHYTAEYATVLMQLGQFERARALAESVCNGRAERSSEHGAKLNALRVLIAESLKRLDRAKALVFTENALRFAPNDPELLSCRIQIWKELGNTDAVRREAKRLRSQEQPDPRLIEWLKSMVPE